MLKEIAVGNFRSIGEINSTSMEAFDLKTKDKQPTINNIFTVDRDLKLLKSHVFYGANASGKTNIMLAVDYMRRFVLTSANSAQQTDRIPVNRFRLRVDDEDKPSYFRLDFLIDRIYYSYGFTVTPERVESEWLSYAPTSGSDSITLFDRDGEDITISDEFKEGIGLAERTGEKVLLLSLAARSGGPISGKVLSWISRLRIIVETNQAKDLQEAVSRIQDKRNKGLVLRFLGKLQLGIDDIQTEPEATSRSHNLSPAGVKLVYRKYNVQRLDAGSEGIALEDESAGTQRLFCLALPIMNALKQGSPIFIDDMDAHLHPRVTWAIVDLFGKKQQNPRNAQLIFTSHNSALLTYRRLRREQISFVEKDEHIGTIFYPMSQFAPSNSAYFERDYLKGRFRVGPYIGNDLLPLDLDGE